MHTPSSFLLFVSTNRQEAYYYYVVRAQVNVLFVVYIMIADCDKKKLIPKSDWLMTGIYYLNVHHRYPKVNRG